MTVVSLATDTVGPTKHLVYYKAM